MARQVFAQCEGPLGPGVATALQTEGEAQLKRGQTASALAIFRQCVKIRQRLVPSTNPLRLRSEFFLALALHGQGFNRESQRILARVLPTIANLFPEDEEYFVTLALPLQRQWTSERNGRTRTSGSLASRVITPM
jgi:hypothetical protein